MSTSGEKNAIPYGRPKEAFSCRDATGKPLSITRSAINSLNLKEHIIPLLKNGGFVFAYYHHPNIAPELVQIALSNQNALEVRFKAGKIVRKEDFLDDWSFMSYIHDERMSTEKDPVGETIHYAIEAGRLKLGQTVANLEEQLDKYCKDVQREAKVEASRLRSQRRKTRIAERKAGPRHLQIPSSNTVEVRRDPNDGMWYSRKQFIEEYGNEDLWEQQVKTSIRRKKTRIAERKASRNISGPRHLQTPSSNTPSSDNIEVRRDPNDGMWYSRKEFIEEYGNEDLWKQQVKTKSFSFIRRKKTGTGQNKKPVEEKQKPATQDQMAIQSIMRGYREKRWRSLPQDLKNNILREVALARRFLQDSVGHEQGVYVRKGKALEYINDVDVNSQWMCSSDIASLSKYAPGFLQDYINAKCKVSALLNFVKYETLVHEMESARTHQKNPVLFEKTHTLNLQLVKETKLLETSQDLTASTFMSADDPLYDVHVLDMTTPWDRGGKLTMPEFELTFTDKNGSHRDVQGLKVDDFKFLGSQPYVPYIQSVVLSRQKLVIDQKNPLVNVEGTWYIRFTSFDEVDGTIRGGVAPYKEFRAKVQEGKQRFPNVKTLSKRVYNENARIKRSGLGDQSHTLEAISRHRTTRKTFAIRGGAGDKQLREECLHQYDQYKKRAERSREQMSEYGRKYKLTTLGRQTMDKMLRRTTSRQSTRPGKMIMRLFRHLKEASVDDLFKEIRKKHGNVVKRKFILNFMEYHRAKGQFAFATTIVEWKEYFGDCKKRLRPPVVG